MRIIKYFLCLVVFQLCVSKAVQSQFALRPGKDQVVDVVTSNNEWINFKANTGINSDRFISTVNEYLQISNSNSFSKHRQTTDENGNVHKRYNHYYKGYRVMNSEMITHENNAQLYKINGHVPTALTNGFSININESQAFNTALLRVNAIQYQWQVQALSLNNLHDIPRAEIVWIQKANLSNPYDESEYELAYKFDIVSNIPLNAQSIYISTQTGRVIRVIQLMANCNPVSVTTSFNGVRNISTSLISGSTYRLTNDCSTSILSTINWRHNTYFQKVGNSWTHDTMRAAASSLWAMRVTHNYFSGIHNYNGWDNGNGNWNSYENVLFCYVSGCTPTSPNNASFYRGTMAVGWGNTSNLYDDYNSLDIVGHEFAHGISDTMAHLVYSAEPGAINESFSDIFGNTIQANELGSIPNLWEIGEDRTSSTGTSLPLRDMQNPNAHSQPDTYLGDMWFTGSDDNFGVHYNSGVQNFMYYLLVNGGTGINDHDWSYMVQGIGIIPARRIAFKALVDYMDANSSHQTARNAWLSAAEDLFGTNSNEYKQVANAWFAVGVCSNGGEQLIVECGSRTAAFANTFYTGFKYIYLASGVSCPLTINPSSSLITYTSNNVVVMSPGFVATQGANFKANVVGCVN